MERGMISWLRMCDSVSSCVVWFVICTYINLVSGVGFLST